MPLNFNRIKDQTATVTVEFAGESAAVTYYAKRITKAMMREAAAVDGDGIDKLILQLSRLIAEWEVVDDDGVPLPVTVDVLESFPVEFLVAIMRAINEAATVGEASGASTSST